MAKSVQDLAQNLRKNQTDAEQILWSKLRSRGLSDFKSRRQHPIDNFVLDIYCRKAHLAIEIDGGQHLENNIVEKDKKRTAHLNQKGIRVIRFWNDDVLNHLYDVIAEIDATLSEIMAEDQNN